MSSYPATPAVTFHGRSVFVMPSRARCVSRWVGAALSLALVPALASTARASCGDWLEGHAAEHQVAASAPGLPPSADGDHRSAPPRRTCRGPSCGRSPALPLAPINAPTAPVDHERDAVLACAGATVPSGRGAPIPADTPPVGTAPCGRLERPPRHA
jgi:hypothetical protein